MRLLYTSGRNTHVKIINRNILIFFTEPKFEVLYLAQQKHCICEAIFPYQSWECTLSAGSFCEACLDLAQIDRDI